MNLVEINKKLRVSLDIVVSYISLKVKIFIIRNILNIKPSISIMETDLFKEQLESFTKEEIEKANYIIYVDEEVGGYRVNVVYLPNELFLEARSVKSIKDKNHLVEFFTKVYQKSLVLNGVVQ